ncbi:MAG: hypothetical protein ACD_2C00027G0001 [uncultured bacterium (gcode 4)]|uniref:Uncharacterized protein n=1 Tax=uncultured bacterium (gcode 4) TaxID=1234023 RepID=K2G4M7_9BACT|nr:MAG: hypothetical protein ACD_2C00027G0001 [uncultured bacterium (gcode 4)]
MIKLILKIFFSWLIYFLLMVFLYLTDLAFLSDLLWYPVLIYIIYSVACLLFPSKFKDFYLIDSFLERLIQFCSKISIKIIKLNIYSSLFIFVILVLLSYMFSSGQKWLFLFRLLTAVYFTISIIAYYLIYMINFWKFSKNERMSWLYTTLFITFPTIILSPAIFYFWIGMYAW